MDTLPLELLYKILLISDYKEIGRIGKTNNRAWEIGKKREFWRDKIDSVSPDRGTRLFNKSATLSVLKDLYKKIHKFGDVYGLGSNVDGQLGLGHVTAVGTPTKIMGIHDVVQVSCGNSHGGYLTKDGDVYMVGKNGVGQLGTGDNQSYRTPIVLTQFSDGGNILTNVKIKEISCGNSSTAFVTDEGHIYICGNNSTDVTRLGLGPDLSIISIPTRIPGFNNVKQVSCSLHNAAFVTEDGYLYVFGFNRWGQLGNKHKLGKIDVPTLIAEDYRIKQVSCGVSHTAFITNSNNLFVWGTNSGGQLGLGEPDNYYQDDPIKLQKFSHSVKWVSCGSFLTSFITNDEKLYICGIVEGLKSVNIPTQIYSTTAPIIAVSSNYKFVAFGSANDQLHLLGTFQELSTSDISFDMNGEILGISCGYDSIAIIVGKD